MKIKVFVVCAVIFLFCDIVNAGINDGLVAYYPLNGNANDESGNGHNGTVNGAILTTDRFGNTNSAYSFDGVQDHVIRVPSNNNLNFGKSDFSMSVWIKPNSSSNPQIMGKDNHAGTAATTGYLLRYLDGKGVSFGVRDPISGTFVDSPHPLGYEWTHVVAFRESNVLKLYINGVFDSSMPESSAVDVSNTADFKIGRFDEWYQPSFRGNIDDVRIYNRALSASEIQQLYQGQVTCSTGVVKFTAGTPAKAADVNANFDALNCQIQALKAIVCKNDPTASVCQ
ncbi:MAG: LamG domain-containing protein [Deltaproteobacteria bacterium]|jgi:hypothetical protein